MKFPTPEDAEAAFYRCFEDGDLDGMMAVWDNSNDILCIHPFGHRLEGTDAVRDGWSALLTGQQRLRFRVESSWRYNCGDLTVHAVLEHIRVAGDDTDHTPVIATNAYRLTSDGWRMVLHHSSPQPRPEKAADDSDDAPTLH